MFKAHSISQLIPESSFMTLEQFNSDHVRKQVDDKEGHQKSVKLALTALLKQKMSERKK